MSDSRLLQRLTTIRARVRRRLLVFGVLMVAAGGVVAFLSIAFLDWLLWLPSVVRIVVAVAYLVGFVLAAYHWIGRPLSARLNLVEVADRLERRFPQLGDRLTSSVDFMHGDVVGSPAMVRKVITDTEQLVQRVPLESVLVLRPLLVRGAVVSVGVCVLALIAAGAPGWARMGFYRFVYPWGDLEWPRHVSIRPLTGDQTVAVGDSAVVRMKIQRGLKPNLRGVVRLQEPDALESVIAMQRTADGEFTAMIDRVTRDLTYWFEAGDDTTQRFASKIRVVPRPEVVEAFAVVRPPSYVIHPSDLVHAFADGPARVTVGGSVAVQLQVSKPIRGVTTDSCLHLTDEPGHQYPLQIDASDPTRLTTLIPIHDSLILTASLCDEYGFRNHGVDRYTVLAIPDREPAVNFLEPASIVEVTAEGTVNLLIQVQDDFGITDVSLEVQRGGAEPHTIEMAPSADAGPEHADSGAGDRMHVVYAWPMSDETVHPGDLLTYRAKATDNYVGPLGERHAGWSESMSIHILSAAEFDTRIRSDIALLTARIRETMLDQAEVLDQTTTLSDESAPGTTAPKRDDSAATHTHQSRLIRRTRDLSTRFAEMVGRLKTNDTADSSRVRRVEATSTALTGIATGPMTEAATALDELRDLRDPSSRAANIDRARQGASDAVSALRNLLREISRWGVQKQLLAKSRDYLQRQETIREKTSELGRSLLGLRVDALTPEQSRKVSRLSREQSDLGAEVKQLLDDLQTSAQNSTSNASTDAKRADAALRAAEPADLKRQLSEAEQRLQENRTAAATIAQRSVGDSLRRMVAALLNEESRQLEELRKRLSDAMDLVAGLIAQQRDAHDATKEAGLLDLSANESSDLVDTQRTIRRNTKQLAVELSAGEQTMTASRHLDQAVDPMSKAETYLRDRQTAPALNEQESAVAFLEEALQSLQEADSQTENEVIRRSLAQIRDHLEQIRDAQLQVNEGIGELHKEVGDQDPADGNVPRWTRRETRAATRLARQQADVRSMVERQKGDFERVVVFAWAIRRAAEWMETTQAKLTQRIVDASVVSLADRILAELDRLIQAIVDTEKLPLDTQFVESADGGGGPSGAMQSSKPIPTVSELLVLKAMQGDINKRTNELGENINLDSAKEADLRALKAVGEDQAEVRRLTEMLTQKAREEAASHP